MNIAVIGQGYIGLPTALVLAEGGHTVIGVDSNVEKIEKLLKNELTFKEEGLDALFSRALEKNITFSTDYPSVEMYIVAVPTPYKDDNKKVNPKYLVAASQSIADVAPKNAIVVVESTISPGVVDEYVRPAFENKGRKVAEDIHLVHAPERIIPGNMIKELYHNSRTIGADDLAIAEKVKEAYSVFCKGEMILTNIKTAEISKVVENTYRDINIAFANELSRICHRAGVDVHEVIEVANHHPRVNILSPSTGTGGHCIPVDPWFLVGDYPEDAQLIRKAREVNEAQPLYIWNLAMEDFASVGFDENARVGLYGLTYKENVDDTRMSPTLQLLDSLSAEDKERVIVYDPYVENDMVDNQYHDIDDFLADSDVIIVMISHDEITEKADKLAGSSIFDARGIKAVRKSAENYFTL